MKNNYEEFTKIPRINGGWHQEKLVAVEEETKPLQLKSDIKDHVIRLLFGNVDEETRNELHEYMDARFEQCHSLALHVTEKDRAREPEKKSSFTLLCEKLGLDPGTREVQVTDKLQVLYSHHYTVPGQPR